MKIFMVDDVASSQAVAEDLMLESEIAVDIEGVNLGRKGEICLIQIFCAGSSYSHTRAPGVYLFDIAKMGDSAFEQGKLKTLFESDGVTKVMYDVRADSDALFHLFRVELKNAYDLQVLYSWRFSDRTDPYLKGLQKALDLFLEVDSPEALEVQRIKEKGKRLFAADLGGSPEVWKQRPLPTALVEYAVVDVQYMLEMKRDWEWRDSYGHLDGRRLEALEAVTRDRIHRTITSRIERRGRRNAEVDFAFCVRVKKRSYEIRSREIDFGWERFRSGEKRCWYCWRKVKGDQIQNFEVAVHISKEHMCVECEQCEADAEGHHDFYNNISVRDIVDWEADYDTYEDWEDANC